MVVEFVTPFRDRTLELLDDQAQLTAVLEQGAQRAGAVAEATLRDVYQRVGFVAAGPSKVEAVPTIGVAVAIPEPWATELQDYRDRRRRRHRDDDPDAHHAGAADRDRGHRAPEVEEHLAEVAARSRPFQVHLRGTGTFRPVSPVVFVTLAEGISQCEQLAGAVRQGPLDVDLTFPYHPHVTVAHHLDDDRARPGLRRAGGVRVRLRRRRVPPLRPRRRDRLAADPRLPPRPGGDLSRWPRSSSGSPPGCRRSASVVPSSTTRCGRSGTTATSRAASRRARSPTSRSCRSSRSWRSRSSSSATSRRSIPTRRTPCVEAIGQVLPGIIGPDDGKISMRDDRGRRRCGRAARTRRRPLRRPGLALGHAGRAHR